MNRVIRTLLYLIIASIIIFVVIFYIYPLILKNKVHLTNIDFNSIRNNFIQEEKNFIQKDDSWSLTIPSINLENVKIKESVDSEVLENYIGHFEFSSYLDGNVCLAAHNSGFSNNYFSRLNLLNIGEKVIYSFVGNTREYKVVEKYNISDKDFSVLIDNGINEITLITCVPNSPNLRLCVKAISKEWKKWKK